MSDEPKKVMPTDETEVWNAISAFERILEAVPDDRVALETLHEAYEQIGQSSRALEYLTRLGECVADEQDLDAVGPILEQLQAVKDDDPQAAAVAARLQELLPEPAPNQPAVRAGATAKPKTIDISNELSLAWNLLQAEILTQDEYSSVVHDLSESSTRSQQTPITVLHVLQGRGSPKVEAVLAHLSRESNVPMITLANFEIQKQAYGMLPLDTMCERGALVFDIMGSNLLVAVLNPFDTDLQERLQQMTERTCHFYLVHPIDYDATLNDIRAALVESAAA